jgi:hypothetical protein
MRDLFWVLIFIPAAALSAGCTSQPQDAQESEPLVKLLHGYMQATDALGRPPKDEIELRQHLPKENQDSLFVSPRDGHLYLFRWGVNYKDPMLNPADPPLIAWEREGKAGVRHGISAVGLTTITEEQFAKLPQ